MASFHVPIAKTIPGFMALGLAGDAAGTAMKMWDPKTMKSGKSTKLMIGGFTRQMVGIPLTGAVATQVAAL